MPATRKEHPSSSHDAEKVARKASAKHGAIIKAQLEKTPRKTKWELAELLEGVLTIDQIQKRLSENAQRGDKRACTTGIPATNVIEWYL